MCFYRVHGVISVLLFTRAIHKHGYFKFFLSLKLPYRKKNITRISKKMLVSIGEMTVQSSLSTGLSTGPLVEDGATRKREERADKREMVGGPSSRSRRAPRMLTQSTKFENNLNRQSNVHWPFLLHTMPLKQIAEVKNIGNSMGWAERFPTIHSDTV